MLFLKKILFFSLKILRLNNFKFDTEYGKVFLDFNNEGISQTLFYKNKRESDKVSLIREILNPGDGVIDCGSNIGVYPILESNLIGKDGYVMCIEPDPRNIEVLKKNFKLIDSKKDLLEKALGKDNSEIEINLYKKTNITRFSKIENKFKVENSSDKLRYHKTESIDFEKLLSTINFDHSKIKLLRMDVEGAEIDILQSLSKNINKVPNLSVLFETHPDFYSEHKLLNILDPFFKEGYKFKKLITSGSFNEKFFSIFKLKESKIHFSDGFKRFQFDNVSKDLGIELINHKKPKLIRYVFLSK